MPRLYLLDANGLAHWCYHSHPEMTDALGAPVSALHGVREWLFDFMDRYSPTHIAACFDGPLKSNWRKLKAAEYKSARVAKPKDEALMSQLPHMPGEFERLGVRTLKVDGFEADDIIATLAVSHASPEVGVVVVSSDKDLMQLVGEHVKQFDPRPNKAGQTTFYGPAEVEEKHGVPPHRLQEYLALVGDASDSIPGVEKWGKVKAINAIKQTKSRSELIRKARAGQLEHIDAKHQALLVAQLPAFELSFELVGLAYDVPLDVTLDDLAWRGLPQGEAA